MKLQGYEVRLTLLVGAYGLTDLMRLIEGMIDRQPTMDLDDDSGCEHAAITIGRCYSTEEMYEAKQAEASIPGDCE